MPKHGHVDIFLSLVGNYRLSDFGIISCWITGEHPGANDPPKVAEHGKFGSLWSVSGATDLSQGALEQEEGVLR